MPAAEAVADAKGTNYRVKRALSPQIPVGTVIPRSFLVQGGNLSFIERGLVEPTHEPVTKTFLAPKKEDLPPNVVPDRDTQEELVAAQEELAQAAGVADTLRAEIAEKDKDIANLKDGLAHQVGIHAQERQRDADAVRLAREAEAAVRKELAIAYDRIADLQNALAAKEASDAKMPEKMPEKAQDKPKKTKDKEPTPAPAG